MKYHPRVTSVFYLFVYFFIQKTQQQTKIKNIVLEKCFWDVFTTKKNISNGPFTLRGALNCTLTMNFVKLFVLIHSIIPIPLTLKTLKWMFMRQQPPKAVHQDFFTRSPPIRRHSGLAVPNAAGVSGRRK